MTTKVASTLSMVCLSVVMMMVSCTKDKEDSTIKSYTDAQYSVISASLNLPSEAIDYKNLELPDHLSASSFIGGSVTKHGATLGRVLFYDTRLSLNRTISCSSCHQQEAGFSDTRALSAGYEGQETERNSIALGNVRFYYHDRGFFWDERANSVEDQVEQTVTNHLEMGMPMEDIPERLEEEEYYKILFDQAYGSRNITVDRIKNALSQYVRSVVSFESKFDEAAAQTTGSTWNLINNEMAGLTSEENNGRQLYVDNCSSCHGNVIFLGRSTANNGLDLEYTDKGVGARTNNAEDMGIFKVPHLRNIALSAPYMHDGRFSNLDEVIEHYSTGVQDHPNKAFDLPAGGFNFTEMEKANLKAFLETFTDTKVTEKEMYANPFK